jgi:hypothetical protein
MIRKFVVFGISLSEKHPGKRFFWQKSFKGLDQT